MARSLWKGAISFGLVNIPVELYPAEEHKEFKFSMLDKRDFAPIGYKRYNKKSGKEVDWANIIKGYEYEKDQYVVLSDEDFKRANVKASRTIDIQLFADRSAIAPYYFETPYYLQPEAQGAKVYALLRDAMARADKVAVATFVMRSREHLATLLPENNVLMLNTMRFEQEILPQPKIESGKRAEASSKEVQTAVRLIEEMSAPFKPDKYHDTYRDDLMKRIKEKIKAGESKTLTTPEKGERREERGKVVDLMALLQKSLEENRRGPRRARARGGRRATARRA